MPLTAAVIPARDCADTVAGVLAALPAHVLPIVVDDGSATPIVARGARVVRHARNRGYGAAQKSGYAAALWEGADRVVLLHGDGQYDVHDTLALADALEGAEAVLGSRFLNDARVIPSWRRLGNRALTGVANLRFGTRHTELHSGARAFRADTLRDLPLERFSDDYLFDQQVLVALLRAGVTIAERPVRTKYDGTTQSISFRRSVVYGLGCLRVLTGRV